MSKYYIDLHCHTIASKERDGESRKRNVPSKEFFLNALKTNHVSVVAITNHNHFDRNQFEDFKNNNEGIVVLPGIEIDINLLKNGIGHLIFVSNTEDEKYKSFLDFVSKIKADIKLEACNIKVDIKEFPNLIETLDGLIIVHYGGKDPAFTNQDVNFLKENCHQNLFVEPSNLISAFIYLNKGMNSMVGSDVKDWENYPGKELPELKMPVEDFSRLKLLLNKDPVLIEQKTKTKLFEEKFDIVNEKYNIHEKISLYKDCNVIIGSKSSGKSIFLKAIKEGLSNRGFQSKIKYYSAESVQEEYKKISIYNPTDEEVDTFAKTSNLFKNEINELKKFSFPKFGNPFQQIKEFIQSSSKTRLSKQLGFVSSCTSFTFSSDTYIKAKEILKKDFIETREFRNSNSYKRYLDDAKAKILDSTLEEVEKNILKNYRNEFISYKSLELSQKCIDDFKEIFTQLKSTAAMPNTTGLKELYIKEKSFIANSITLSNVLKRESSKKLIPSGYLDGKGKVSFVTQIESGLNYSKKNSITLFKCGFSKKIKEVSKKLDTLCNSKFNDDTAKNIQSVSKILIDNEIESIKEFLGYTSYFVRENGTKFEPSKGEQAILVLSNCLNDNNPSTDFYLLDEPEMSVGHHYVNSTIVPRIKQLCDLNKCVIICTHDANIGVGTLPFQVIYREEDKNGLYHTYQGNPFTDILIDQLGNKIGWKETVVNILEGGRDALDLREVTYGDRD